MSKSDRELIEEYEPVLRFACGEYFVPMAVEDYVAACELLEHRRRRPDRRNVEWAKLDVPQRLQALAGLSSDHYLQLKRDADSYLMPLALLLLAACAAVAAFYFFNWTGVAWVVGSAVILAAFSWAAKSNHRLYIITLFPAAVFSAIYFHRLGRGYVGAWASAGLMALQLGIVITAFIDWRLLGVFLLLGGVGCGYAAWTIYGGHGLWPAVWVMPAQFGGSFLIAVMGRFIIGFGPGFLFSVFSKATEEAAAFAEELFATAELAYAEKHPPTYSARVLRVEGWTVLQYFYFYAFNDYRRTASGLNQHEADWEMVAVFLEGETPRGLAFSAHHQGTYCEWDRQVRKATRDGHETSHPLIYVALGSHANYPDPGARDVALDEVLHGARFGRFQHLLARLVVAVINLDERIRVNLRETMTRTEGRGRRHEYQPFVPRDYATGDGVRIGFAGTADDLAREAAQKRADFLSKDELPETCAPLRLAWSAPVLLPDPLPAWVEYKGLWGIRSVLVNESGPPGPKWDRVVKGAAGPGPRVRWEKPLEWKRVLQNPEV